MKIIEKSNDLRMSNSKKENINVEHFQFYFLTPLESSRIDETMCNKKSKNSSINVNGTKAKGDDCCWRR